MPQGAATRGHFLSVARRDFFWAWLAATVLSGIPSTAYALATGGDPTEATRAAGAMLISSASSLPKLMLAAAIVHSAISLFWAVILTLLLPNRHVALWAVVAGGLIAFLDLRLIAPRLFPEVAALAFWPQFADHLMWGISLGAVLQWRRFSRD
jgi:hypothetical protein